MKLDFKKRMHSIVIGIMMESGLIWQILINIKWRQLKGVLIELSSEKLEICLELNYEINYWLELIINSINFKYNYLTLIQNNN